MLMTTGKPRAECTVLGRQTLSSRMEHPASQQGSPVEGDTDGRRRLEREYDDPGSLMTSNLGASDGDELDSTVALLNKARSGDRAALEELVTRCLPPLRRWARGRLPAAARGALETQDLVQDTLLNALSKLDTFESRHEGALQAYLRQAVLNRIRDEVRKLGRRPQRDELHDTQPAEQASPLDIAIGREGVERYEAALRRLRSRDREAIVGRIEMQHDYQQLATILGKPNANAARVAVTRALARLLEQMDHEG
jgi:RNA polymerase sigma-70 factor, ECF subfamily